DDLVVGSATRVLDELGVIVGARVVAPTQRQADGCKVGTQRFELFGRRPLVYPIQTVALVACHELGGTGVGRQHTFFDELVGIVAYHGLDALDATEVGTYDTRLDRIEIDGTTFDASRRKQLVKLVQVAYVRHERTQRSRGRAVGLLQ